MVIFDYKFFYYIVRTKSHNEINVFTTVYREPLTNESFNRLEIRQKIHNYYPDMP